MRHNPETYALRTARAFLKRGLSNLLEFPAENRSPERGDLAQLRCAVADLEFVVMAWPDKKVLYFSELGYLAVREREQELFCEFAILFAEIVHSLNPGRRLRLQLIRHAQFEKLRQLGRGLLDLMEPDEIDQLEEAPVTVFLVETKLGSGDKRAMYCSILREVFALYDADRYPIWHPETKRNWFDSDDEPFTPAEFEDWLFQPDGHEWFYGRYAFSKDESHSVFMDGDNVDTFLTFTVANEDVPKAREMISKIDGLYQIIIEYQPGRSDEIAHVYGKHFVKLQQPDYLVADRFALREALVKLTDPKFNEWWKVETCFLKLQKVIELLDRLCVRWEDRREDYLSENGHLAIRADEFEEFELLAVLYEQIRDSCSRGDRFEFEFVKDARWEQLVELGRCLLPKIDLLNSPGFNENTTSFRVYVKPDEPESDLPRDLNYIFVLEQILHLYDSHEYPFWYPKFYHPRAVYSYEVFLTECIDMERWSTSDFFAFAQDESHSVHLRLEEQGYDNYYIEFSIENSIVHLVKELAASINGLYTQFLMVDKNKNLVEYKF